MLANVLVTGASGFIGKAVVRALAQAGHKVVVTSRHVGDENFVVAFSGDITPDSDWTNALDGIDVVIHLAARAHVLNEVGNSPEAEFMRVNHLAATNLAQQCANAGVKRFIFFSSIGVSVNNFSSIPISEETTCSEVALYAMSKQRAESDILAICHNSDMDLVIVRPPLVYGPGAPGNFGRLIRLAKSPFPLPFGAANNKRNFIALANLTDFTCHCVQYEGEINNTFVVADDETISTKLLISKLREGMGRSPRLIPFPPRVFKLLVSGLGKPQFYEQLFCDLQVDNTKAKTILGWSPPHTAQEQLKKCGVDAKNNLFK